MKKLTKMLLCLLLLVASGYYANATIIASLTFTRLNSSGILGAGTVTKGHIEKLLGFSPTGEAIVSREERISCTGCCFKSCPDSYSIVKNDPEPPLLGDGMDEVSVQAIDNLLLYALNQITDNKLSGSHSFTQAVVTESGISLSYHFSVSWEVNDQGESTINVHRTKI